MPRKYSVEFKKKAVHQISEMVRLESCSLQRAYEDQFGVEAIWRVLQQADRGFITSRGYRKASTRIPSARALSDSLLIPEIQRVHADNFSVYGSRKIWHAMNREGFHIGRDKAARLIKLAGVSGRRRGRNPVTTISAKVPDHRPDLVQRNFRAQAPGRLWVADITYLRTLSGFAYTVFLTDVYNRKIVGVATRSTMRTDALPMAGVGACSYCCRPDSWKPTGPSQRSG